MTISSISNSLVYTSSQIIQPNSASQDASTPEISGSAGHHRRHSGGSDFMKAIEQALSQMGLSLNPQSPSSPQTTSGTDNDGSSSSSSVTGNSRQALHAFMHDLFNTLKTVQAQTSGTTSSSTASGSYSSNLTTGIQDIINALGGGSSSTSTAASTTQNGDLTTLQSDFQNLVSSLGGGSSTGTQSSDLQTFLQNLVQNINGQQNGSDPMDAMAQSFSQMGLGVQAANSTGNASTDQVMQTFMQDLFATAQDGSTSSNNIASGSYSSNLTTGLQDIINALGSSSTSTGSTTQNGDLTTLQSDFQTLVSSLGGGSSTGTQSSDLQTFLQNLVQNINRQQASSPAVGTFISSIA